MVGAGEGWLYFCNGCEDGEGRCNGRGKQGKDALSVCAQGLCKDAKPTKHTQTLTLRKAGGIVRFGRDGVAIPPVVARIFSGDSTSPLARDGHGCPKLNAQSFKHGCLKSATQSRCTMQRH